MIGKESDKSGLIRDPRVLLLVAGIIVSIILIHPHPTDGGVSTNLNYGLELAGGSWLQLELQGAIVEIDADPARIIEYEYRGLLNDSDLRVTEVKTGSIRFVTTKEVTEEEIEDLHYGIASLLVEENRTTVGISTTREEVIRRYLQNRLDTEVKILRVENGTAYEIRRETNESEIKDALKAVNGRVISYTRGVSEETRRETKTILDTKLNAIGLKDIPIRTVGEDYILIDLAGVDIATAMRMAATPGKFEIRIQTRENETAHVLYGNEIEHVGIPRESENVVWGVPFRLTKTGAEKLREAALKYNATRDPSAHHLLMYLDKKEVFSGPLVPSLAEKIEKTPVRVLVAQTGAGEKGREEAKELQIHLRAGALPVNVKVIGSGQVSATLGARFKEELGVAGILTLIAVALIVYRRYKHREIIIPMLSTTMGEVIMILGFAAAVNWQLDLASLTAIIAVIGTGIDHLIIITDEVLHQERGELPTEKVFKDRIRRAFTTIFAAAATTIAAMIPLGYMGFGALRGFAIVTIVGVLIGILIARPAYGAIIRHIITQN